MPLWIGEKIQEMSWPLGKNFVQLSTAGSLLPKISSTTSASDYRALKTHQQCIHPYQGRVKSSMSQKLFDDRHHKSLKGSEADFGNYDFE